MAIEKLVWCGENPDLYSREELGGKGYNLLRLYSWAQQTGKVEVPSFFIIPTSYPRSQVNCFAPEGYLEFKEDAVKNAFEKLRNPAIARSSSPYEDGVNASFAGLFKSIPNQLNYEGLTRALGEIEDSSVGFRVNQYVERMNIDNYNALMAFIVQEQVIHSHLRGTIQLGEEKAEYSTIYPGGETFPMEVPFNLLEGHGPRLGVKEEPHDFVLVGEEYNAVQCARDAARDLGFNGEVQVEYFLSPTKKPQFVQIRQLPKISSTLDSLDLEVPKGVPCLESTVCNGVAGDISLPAYVTFSQAGFSGILIETGQMQMDERAERWQAKSNLYRNYDFHDINKLRATMDHLRFSPLLIGVMERHNLIWERGNALFPEYILVCNKLDESVVGMAEVTTCKKGIITCLEADKTSHAMTVARDLGIPAMGVRSDIMDLDSFYNQVQTGDTVRLKSDGKRAVAYIEKKRECDPYKK